MHPVVPRSEQTVLNHGTTAAVITYTKGRVIKTHAGPKVRFDPPQPSIKSLIREREIYEALGEHPYILKYYGSIPMDGDGGASALWLERAEYDTIRSILEHSTPLPVELLPIVNDSRTRWRWIFQLISALAHLHAHSFIHCDISCRNIVVTSSLDAKLIDFGSSAILREKGLGAEEARYSCPLKILANKLPSFQSDIFALGSAMYEILTGSPPYNDITSEEAEERFELLQFPNTANLGAGDVILGCWMGKFLAVTQVESELKMVTFTASLIDL